MNKNLTYGPGPAQYNITGLASKGKDTPPQISLQSRAKPNKIIETPAPGNLTEPAVAQIVFPKVLLVF